MKHTIQLTTWLLAGMMIVSCKKGKIESKPAAAINVVASVISGGNVKLNTNARDSAKAYNAKAFVVVPGTTILLYPTTGSTTPYFDSNPDTENGGIYSIFLTGQSPTFESIFVKETALDRYTDSSLGIRVINLSPNSVPMHITLASDVNTNIFSGIAYKQLTEFVKLPLKTTIPTGSVTFQVRSSVDNSILTSYTLPTSVNSTYPNISITASRDRKLTLVIKGLQGTTGSNPDAFGIFPVALY